MTKVGLSVLLQMFVGNRESAETFAAAIGKTITALELTDNELRITLADGSRLALYDAGQSCCESRYMHSEDNLPYFVGATLMGVEVRPAPRIPHAYEEHEVEFLDVMTSKGVFQMVNHNEHNGYYGGFAVQCKPLAALTPTTEPTDA